MEQFFSRKTKNKTPKNKTLQNKMAAIPVTFTGYLSYSDYSVGGGPLPGGAQGQPRARRRRRMVAGVFRLNMAGVISRRVVINRNRHLYPKTQVHV